MDITSFVDLKELQRIQDLFSDATGLAAIAVDAQGSYITKGSNFTEFCMKYTRGSAEGAKRCIKCDNECKGTYFCHAGLMDFASDIMVNGERVGAVIGGQVLPNPPDAEKFRVIARELGISEEAYLDALKKVPIRSEKMIRAAAQLLGSVVNQLVNLSYFKKLNEKKIELFDAEMGNAQKAAAEIKEITRGLEQVASMENILSVNASIEAGRAGAAGAGFAVVAREIGQLSHNAAESYAAIQRQTEQVSACISKMSDIKL
ncbi:MAG: PocR ligand-binding domain-containing protein [Oscillospiraceae bacterium]|nr:PocR ligand-binding domain-containing protein [Oscillospiraceae bacterium]